MASERQESFKFNLEWEDSDDLLLFTVIDCGRFVYNKKKIQMLFFC